MAQLIKPVDAFETAGAGGRAPFMRGVLLALFILLLADEMFGWGLGLGTGLSVKNALLYLLLVMMLVDAALQGRKATLEPAAVQGPFLLLIAWATCSWITNSVLDFGVGYQPLQHFIALKGRLVDHFLFFIAFYLAVRTREDAFWVIRWIIGFLIVANLVTVIDAYDVPDLGIISHTVNGRVNGPLGEPNEYGAFVAMFLPALASLIPGTTGWRRWFYLFGLVLFTWVLLLTVSRGAFAGLIVGCALAAVILRRHLNARVVGTLALAGVALLGMVLVLLGEEFIDLLGQRTISAGARGDAYEMSSGRTWIWKGALMLQLERPISVLLGYGWSTFRNLNPLSSHNVFLSYLFELGLLGLLLFLLLLRGVVVAAARSMDRPENRALAAGVVVGLLSFATASFFVVPNETWYFVWAYIGVALRAVAANPEPVVAPLPLSARFAAVAQQPERRRRGRMDRLRE